MSGRPPSDDVFESLRMGQWDVANEQIEIAGPAFLIKQDSLQPSGSLGSRIGSVLVPEKCGTGAVAVRIVHNTIGNAEVLVQQEEDGFVRVAFVVNGRDGSS